MAMDPLLASGKALDLAKAPKASKLSFDVSELNSDFEFEGVFIEF